MNTIAYNDTVYIFKIHFFCLFFKLKTCYDKTKKKYSRFLAFRFNELNYITANTYLIYFKLKFFKVHSSYF